MDEQKRQSRGAALDQARERGWITLDELMHLASGSPVDLDDARDLTQAAGIELVDTDGDPWEEMHALAEEGPSAFSPERPAPAFVDEPGGSDAATLYLREISQTPLLTAEEEVQLAKEIEAGKAAAARMAEGVGDASERESLQETMRRGEAARRRMIESNLRLVVSVARDRDFRSWTWSRRATSGCSAGWRSMTGGVGSAFPPTPTGGSARRSAGRWPSRAGRSGCRYTSSSS